VRPVPLATELMPHQREAVEKLSPVRVGALFMEMGTGKSRTAIELAARRAERISRVVWFCPVSLMRTVRDEIYKHVRGARVYVFDEKSREGCIPSADWYVVGIEGMSLSDRIILAVNSIIEDDTMVVLDESSYIKGHRASRTQWITRVGARAHYRLILTGTPISQGIEDLYTQMRFLSPDILGYRSWYSFQRNHLEYHPERRGQVVRAKNEALVAARIAPYTYQVTKEECLNLPAKIHVERTCWMTAEQRALYERAKEEILLSVPEDDWTSTTIYRLFGALQQITCGFWNRYAKGEGPELIEVEHHRLSLLQETLAQLAGDKRVIIWTKYRRCLHEISDMLAREFGAPPVTFYGDLNPEQRQQELQRWREGGTRFFVSTPSCGGHGLTLNEADHAVFFTNGFKYSERIQAEDRCHRIGQTMPVTYVDITCEDSIDERISAAIRRKENVVEAFKSELTGADGGGRRALLDTL